MIKLLQGIFILLILSVYNDAEANNIRVKKFHLTDTVRSAKTVNLTFDLSWENSWRDDVNWDAAWIILKVKRANGSWKHIKLQPTGNSIIGNPASAKIVVPDDKMGAFIYRSTKGDGNMDMTGVKFAWNYGADSVANIDSTEVRVFATEMVYVPEGSFAFGDMYTSNVGYFSATRNRIVQSIFKNIAVSDTSRYGKDTPMFGIITNQTSVKLSAEATSGFYSGDQMIIDGFFINGLKGIGNNPTEPFKYPEFPVGYKAFYCMKYEATQGQYTDFLNSTLATGVTNGPAPMQFDLLPRSTSPNNPLSRFSIEKQGDIYTVSRPDRAMDYVSPDHVFAFANWSSLRPMTELEFEKAARGPLAPSYGDRANGKIPNLVAGPGSSPPTISTLVVDGPENGTEKPTILDSTKFLNYNAGLVTGGDGGSGAYRVGIFATDKSSRISSGSSYYGVMGLTDNVNEYVISISNDQSRAFKEHNGVGENKPTGQPIYTHWNLTVPVSLMQRGQSVSDRSNMIGNYYGFRLVRLAPSAN